jgi:hypothetical protein
MVGIRGPFSSLEYNRMKFWLLILFALSCRAASPWQTNQLFYLWTNNCAGIALTTNVIHGIDHAVGSLSDVQIGNYSGRLSGYCTASVNCPAPIPNCTWVYDHLNVTNDRLLFITCRPITNGIAYIQTNMTAGDSLVWFSTVSQDWITATLAFDIPEGVVTFADGMTAYTGIGIMQGQQGVSGDSGSPVFTANGDFCGSVNAISGSDLTIFKYAYPGDSQYRPVSPGLNIKGAAGLSGLFNSDPDR